MKMRIIMLMLTRYGRMPCTRKNDSPVSDMLDTIIITNCCICYIGEAFVLILVCVRG
jgi:hypothetical protein